MSDVKLSDYVADFLSRQGIGHAFVISGGASIHLLHSVANHPTIAHICPHHEQAAAMAADAYARVTGNLGCAIATSGPGATNLITGIAGAWFDSVPVLFLTGQVTTFRMKGETGVRQLGFQETEIIPMVVPITKYCVQLTDKLRIRYELEKAIHIAKSGRPGPVLIDIPDDLQRECIDPSKLEGFTPDAKASAKPAPNDQEITRALALISKAQRPVLVLGWGVRLAGAVEKASALAEHLGFPVLTSWGAKDIIPGDHELLAGTFGTHGTRAGNFAVQNADLVLGIGARMSTRETGSPMESWAREANIILVDIDPAELAKFPHFGKKLDLPIHADAGVFIETLLAKAGNVPTDNFAEWRARVAGWKERYPACLPAAHQDTDVNPYAFAEIFAKEVAKAEHIFIDTGCAIAWLMQAGNFKSDQRLYHDFNNTAMGWALPAAIGGSLALGNAPVTCISGDGALMMNIQELATIKRHDLPVRLFVLNNQGYGMVRQTEEQWLDGKYVGTSSADLAFPDFVKLAQSFDIPALTIAKNSDITGKLREAFGQKGPVVVDVVIPPHHKVIPQAKFGYPIEDSEPLLPLDEFLENMIVQPMPKSLKRAS